MHTASPTLAPTRSVILVCNPALLPQLHAWKQHRSHQGWRVEWKPPEQLPLPQDQAATHVLLVGHPEGAGPFHLPTVFHAPAYRHMETRFHGDFALVHGALTAPPKHAVGRLPARDARSLANMLGKVLDPVAPPARVQFMDGDPMWGRALAYGCNVLAAVGASSRLANGCTVERQSFNPVNTRRATGEDVLRQAAALWVYVGHGQRQSVDGLHVRDLLKLDGGAPVQVALLACCHAGSLEGDSASVAEAWLACTGGAAAVVAGSNVTDPRLNPALAMALAAAVLRPAGTLGDAWLTCQQALLDGPVPAWAAALRMAAPGSLRRAHLGLYSLLGDPTMPLAAPKT